jgi:hypothetical protein
MPHFGQRKWWWSISISAMHPQQVFAMTAPQEQTRQRERDTPRHRDRRGQHIDGSHRVASTTIRAAFSNQAKVKSSRNVGKASHKASCTTLSVPIVQARINELGRRRCTGVQYKDDAHDHRRRCGQRLSDCRWTLRLLAQFLQIIFSLTLF